MVGKSVPQGKKDTLKPTLQALVLADHIYSVYKFRAYLCPRDKDGEIVVYASSLPGVMSQGRTEQEALKDIAVAFAGVVESYLAAGEEIPWAPDKVNRGNADVERWVVAEALKQ